MFHEIQTGDAEGCAEAFRSILRGEAEGEGDRLRPGGIHVLIALFLSACLVYLYCVILTGATLTRFVWGAMAALVAEGMVFLALGMECPLSMWQRRYGDDKGFFDLFLPGRSPVRRFRCCSSSQRSRVC